MNLHKTLFIMILVAGITALHYFTRLSQAPLHVIYREMYFIPIIFAGFWGGRKAGLITSIAATFLFLPHFYFLHISSELRMGSFFELVLFNVIGFLAGAYTDIRKGYMAAPSTPYHPTRFSKEFLLYVDNTPFSLYAANYFADMFGNIPDVRATLLWIRPEVDPDIHATPEGASAKARTEMNQGQAYVQRAREILLQAGMAEDSIHVKMVRKDKKSKIADVIQNEVKNSTYNAVVIGKRPLTKPQEFMFGSVTIGLIRDSTTSVISVKSPEIEDIRKANSVL